MTLLLDVDALEQVARKATQGKWEVGPTPRYLAMGQIHNGVAPLTIRSPHEHTEEIATVWTYLLPTEANAEHIATFDPPTCLALLERARRAEERVKELEAELEKYSQA